MGYVSRDDGRSISRNVAHLNKLVHDMINLLYYEYWADKQKYLYVNKTKGKSKCAICLTERSFIHEIEYDLESKLEIYLFTDWYYKHEDLLC